jgi:hypothetical protein
MAVGGIKNGPCTARDNGWGRFRKLGNGKRFQFTELFFATLGKYFRNGSLRGLGNSLIRIDKRHGEPLREQRAYGAFPRPAEAEEPEMGGPLHGRRVAGNGVFGECGSQFQGLGKRYFSGTMEAWQILSAISIA